MNRYMVDIVHKKAYRMSVWADNEEEARERAEIEAPEKIVRNFARLKHIEYEVYDIFRNGGEIDEEGDD